MVNKKNRPASTNATPTVVTILLLILFYPVGLIVMWAWAKWQTSVKVIITIVFVLLSFILIPLFLVLATGILVYMNPSLRSTIQEELARESLQKGELAAIDTDSYTFYYPKSFVKGEPSSKTAQHLFVLPGSQNGERGTSIILDVFPSEERLSPDCKGVKEASEEKLRKDNAQGTVTVKDIDLGTVYGCDVEIKNQRTEGVVTSRQKMLWNLSGNGTIYAVNTIYTSNNLPETIAALNQATDAFTLK